jgi:drug/metabolite transporter (DMT)-like permease
VSLERIAPALFVLLWSSGWIVPVYAARHSTAEAFLSVRFACAAVCFILVALVLRAPWQRNPRAIGHAIVSGLLMHGVYLGGVWWAIFNGVPASISGVIAALQPLMTAAIAPWMVSERLSRTQLFGLMLGFAGIVVALIPTFEGLSPAMFAERVVPVAVNILAMSGAVLGTLYQKRFVTSGDMRTNAVWQYVGALLIVVPLALLGEPARFEVTLELMLALGWSVLVLSMAAVALLLYLIGRGQVSRAASLIYLMPPTVAIESFILLGEPLHATMISGTVIVVIGVWLAGRKPQPGEL